MFGFILFIIILAGVIATAVYFGNSANNVSINTEECADGIKRGIDVNLKTGAITNKLSQYKDQVETDKLVAQGKQVVNAAKVEAATIIYKGKSKSEQK